MRIRAGNYIINSDRNCYWISEIKETKKDGKEYEVVIGGYHRELCDLLESFVKASVRRSDAEEIKTLIVGINEAVNAAQELITAFRKGEERE